MESDQLLTRKYGRRFDMFDTNKDGVIRQCDFAGVAARLVRRFCESPHCWRAERIRTVYEALWLSVITTCGDIDSGRVTQARFLNALAANQSDLGRRISSADSTAITLCVTDQDGFLDISELTTVIVELGAHPSDGATVRETLKHRYGGLAPLAALTTLLEEFYRSAG